MKITTAMAVTIGIGALAACSSKTQNNAAENVELNATTTEMNATTTTENMEMNAMPTENAGNAGATNAVTNNGY